MDALSVFYWPKRTEANSECSATMCSAELTYSVFGTPWFRSDEVCYFIREVAHGLCTKLECEFE